MLIRTPTRRAATTPIEQLEPLKGEVGRERASPIPLTSAACVDGPWDYPGARSYPAGRRREAQPRRFGRTLFFLHLEIEAHFGASAGAIASEDSSSVSGHQVLNDGQSQSGAGSGASLA